MSEVNGVRITEQRQYQITVSGGEVIPASEYRTERQMRVEWVSLNYRRVNGDAWVLDTPKVGGTVLRKDGSESKNRTSRGMAYRSTDWPGWLTDLALAYNPGRDIAAQSKPATDQEASA